MIELSMVLMAGSLLGLLGMLIYTTRPQSAE